MTFLVSHSSLTMLKFPNLNFEGSSESWYFHVKLRIKIEASNRTFRRQVETSDLQGHAWCILTVSALSTVT